MERKLFDWKEFDVFDTMLFVFYECTIKVIIEEHTIGTKFSLIKLDFEHGIMELYLNEESEPEVFDLDLNWRKK